MSINIPESIKSYLGGRSFTLDSIGESGATVMLFDDMALKIERQSETSDRERKMMEWLAGKLPVPAILCVDTIDGINYLLMSRLSGKMACDERCLEKPDELTTGLAEALKMLWSVDVSGCPCQSDLDYKLRLAAYNVEHGLIKMNHVEPETFGENGFKSPAHLLTWLLEHQPDEEPVLSHGDFCLPNVFLEHGRISGFLDLGRCGTADKWQDIALCYRSLSYNLSGEYDGRIYNGNPDTLFEKLGIAVDKEKLRYYILLDELL